MGKGSHVWYFTFGINTPNEEYVQPITAKDSMEARNIMFDKYGSNWAFQYHEDEWKEHLKEPYVGFDKLIELELLYLENINKELNLDDQ